MDKCTKFKVFNVLLVFCATNFFLYRYFSRPSTPVMVADGNVGVGERSRELTQTGLFSTGSALVNGSKDGLGVVKNSERTLTVISADGIVEKRLVSGDEVIGNTSSDGGKPASADSKTTESGKPAVEDNGKPTGANQVFTQPGGNLAGDGQTVSGGDGNPSSGVPADGSKPSTLVLNTQGASSPTGQSQSAEKQMTSDANATHPFVGPFPLCPETPPKLIGALATYTQASSFEETAAENAGLQSGGRYQPPDCVARYRVAIVIPYRNREEHLKILLKNLHPILMRQQLDYGIFVIDQALPGKFNRAMLMNIGYAEAMKRYDYQCAIFHDVDLIPENDRNIYSCPDQPRHLSAAIDKFKYRLPYAGIYGGVSAVSKEQFEKLNGFSNMFFGWGGEDDDMAKRIRKAGMKITRYPMDIARYKMIKHTKDSGNEQNPQRFALLKTTEKRMSTDGLNSLKYTVQAVEELPTHLRIQVLINEAEITGKAG